MWSAAANLSRGSEKLKEALRKDDPLKTSQPFASRAAAAELSRRKAR
jgi:hypothetical protein